MLRGVDLDIPAGGYVALTGRSGAGKSTLLSLVGGLESPTEGEIDVGGHAVGRLRGNALADFRRDAIGFVFQHFGLLSALTAAENVELSLTLTGAEPGPRRRRAKELLQAVGLGNRLDHRPPALSGGERQRVAIARALANRPRVILADEPTGNLDEEAGAVVLELLEALRTERGCTLVVVTHNRAIADRAVHRYQVEDGRVHRR
ncbi:MAG: ABC transporter ATP-binding protein [Candidatus Dormibacteraeota bacterium]|nr:ABC transporter ATP-binding protein [Candidatus Dormibacteraeota bacterium]